MGRGSGSPLIRYLRTIAAASEIGELSDGELLNRFIGKGDEAAFALLVRRHGPFVLGVCRRLLRQEEDAEDAFQATFLLLATKAAAIRRRTSVASWLHGVAERVARRARRTQARRRDRAMPLPELTARESIPDLFWRDVRLVLDEEIGRLPERYREPFVLCYLEGQTNAEAARRLGCPKGTVLSRLARARERLAQRLRLRNIALPAAALASILSAETLRAAVPPRLAESTVRLGTLMSAGQTLSIGVVSAHVLSLTTEGVKIMSWIKMTAVLAVVLTGGGLMAIRVSRPMLGATNAQPVIAAVATPDEKPMPEPPGKEKKQTEPNPFEQPYKFFEFLHLMEAVQKGKLPPEPNPYGQAYKQFEANKRKETGEAEKRLKAVLRKWAESDEASREMRFHFTRTVKEAGFNTETMTKGEVSCKKPDLWRVNLRNKGGRLEAIWLLEKKLLHKFDFKDKTELIGPNPENWPTAWEPVIFGRSLAGLAKQVRWLILGPQARDFTAGPDIHLAKEDQWYVYLDFKPSRGEDRTWISRGRVVLNKSSYHLRQFWLEQANGDQTLVDFLDYRTNPEVSITPDDLSKGLPKGWKRIESPATKDADK